MKKIYKTIVALIMVALLMLTVVACNDKDTHKGAFTHEINNADELLKVGEMVGKDFDEGTFELKSDIDLTDNNWSAIGTSVENSFRGVFNGNGHTISYKINVDEPDERDTTVSLQDEKFYGLFGVIHNATINNLVINVDITVPADASSIYVGALCGFMSGECNVSNVTINGYVATTMGNICKIKVSEDGSQIRELERYEMTGYVGGLAGYIKGSTNISNINSNALVSVGSYNDGAYRSALNDAFVGGVVGAMRPVDLSSLRANTNYCSAKNLTFTGSVSATANHLDVGGIFGSAFRIKDGEKWVANASSVKGYACKRLRVGGVAGIIDRVSINKTSAVLNSVNAETFSSSPSRSFNAGGLVGYCANFSTISNAISEVDRITVSLNTNNYTGGLVGVLHFSKITNAVSSGDLYYGNDSILTLKSIKYTGSTANNAYYTYNGGIAGRVYGESSLDNLASDFKAYQGIVGETAKAIEIVSIKEDNGETFEGWLATTVYDTAQITWNKEGDKEDGEQKYRISHNYDVSKNNYSFINANVRCVLDQEDYPVEAGERFINIGQGTTDITAYNSLYNAISSNINA